MPQLIMPTAALESAWRAARAEWGPGVHEDGFGLQPNDDVDTAAWQKPAAGACRRSWLSVSRTTLRPPARSNGRVVS